MFLENATTMTYFFGHVYAHTNHIYMPSYY